MALPDYNRQFLQKVKRHEPVFNNSERYGVQIKKLSESTIPINAKQYWRVIGVHHLTGSENRGNHHVYCDVLDGDGRRINRARLVLTQGNAAPVYAVIDKPPNEAGTNFPLWSQSRATVAVAYPKENPLPSESVSGIRTDHADEEIGNTWGHHSFYVVFQLTNIPAPTPPEPEPEPDDEIEAPKPPISDEPEPPTSDEPPTVGEPPLSLEETISLVGDSKIIPLNPNAMFYKIAGQKSLGERLTREYDVHYQGKVYRAQIYERGIVYAEVGDWGNVNIIPRTN